MPDQRQTMALATAGSLFLLIGAYAFQYLGGLLPCVLCWYQRYPHFVALAIGLVALSRGGRLWPLLAAAAVLTSAGIGLFHVGVEQGWWPGLEQCAVNALSGVNPEDLLDLSINVAAPVACDKIAWSLAGISMAGWNALASTAIALLWLSAARRG